MSAPANHIVGPLNISCPFCGAPVGGYCETNGPTTSGLPVKPHKQRERAAKIANERQTTRKR